MKSLGAIFRPFTHCCGAPAVPKTRFSKDIDAGKAQADAKTEADAEVKADAKADGKFDRAAETDAVEPSSQHGQATDMPNAGLQEPRSSIASMPDRPLTPPAMPVEDAPVPGVPPQPTSSAEMEDAAFMPEAEEGVAGFPPEADRDAAYEAPPAPGPDGLPEPVGVPAHQPVAAPEPGSLFTPMRAPQPSVVVHYVTPPQSTPVSDGWV